MSIEAACLRMYGNEWMRQQAIISFLMCASKFLAIEYAQKLGTVSRTSHPQRVWTRRTSLVDMGLLER